MGLRSIFNALFLYNFESSSSSSSAVDIHCWKQASSQMVATNKLDSSSSNDFLLFRVQYRKGANGNLILSLAPFFCLLSVFCILSQGYYLDSRKILPVKIDIDNVLFWHEFKLIKRRKTKFLVQEFFIKGIKS